MGGISLIMAGAEVNNIPALLAVMHRRLSRWDTERDNRAAFLRTYATMTACVEQKRSDRFFLDSAWIERVAVRFGWYFFNALDRYERGEQAPPAWTYAFEVARRRRGFLLQDVLLGMNAHINNDLPQVVAAILRDEADEHHVTSLTRRQFDHDQINRVLHLVIPDCERQLASHYGRLILPLGRVMGALDQSLSMYGLKNWRDTVWKNAQFLLAAADEAEQQQLVHFIEADALKVAKEIEDFPVLSWVRPLAPLMRRNRLC